MAIGVVAVRLTCGGRVQAAGIDVPLGEIGAEIQEVMESYELELDGVLHPSTLRALSWAIAAAPACDALCGTVSVTSQGYP